MPQAKGLRPKSQTSSYQGLGAAAATHRKHQCRKGLLLRQFSGRLTASDSELLNSDRHLGALLSIKLIFRCSDNSPENRPYFHHGTMCYMSQAKLQSIHFQKANLKILVNSCFSSSEQYGFKFTTRWRLQNLVFSLLSLNSHYLHNVESGVTQT